MRSAADAAKPSKPEVCAWRLRAHNAEISRYNSSIPSALVRFRLKALPRSPRYLSTGFCLGGEIHTMAFSPDYRTYQGAPGSAAASAAIDAGLRSYMLRVYNWMTSGLLLTGTVAYAIAHTGLIDLFYHQVMTPRGLAVQPTGLAILAMLAPLAFVLVLSLGIN